MPNSGAVEAPLSVPLECLRAKAGQEVARVLGIEPGAPVILIRRVLKFADRPTVIEEIYLRGEAFPGLNLAILKEAHRSLYSLFEVRFGVRMVRAEERLRAVAADRGSAELLGVAEGTALLSVERIAFSYGDKAMEWRRGLYVTREHFYHNELS